MQEGRLGYEQYAAHSLKLWNIQAANALSNPPVKTVEIDGIKLQIDERNFKNSGATNYLTNDPGLTVFESCCFGYLRQRFLWDF